MSTTPTSTIEEIGNVPDIRTDLPGPNAKAMIERDECVTSTSYTRDFPFVADYGRGCAVVDVDGNRFLDFAAGIAVCATGHAHPEVVAAIQEQAGKLIHICGSDFYYEPMIRLCELLNEIAPGDSPKRSFLTNSGAETIEAAIKLSRRTTGRKALIAFHGAFHGRTMGALSLTSSKVRQKQYFSPMLPMVHHATYGDICAIHEIFRRQVGPDEVAAIIVEPMQGEGGYVLPDPGFLPALRKLCDEHGIMLVCDEIQSGVGRTGKWFACQHSNVVPDILCVAKGIASGMPIGALVANESIMTWPPGSHGSTYGGNPLACASAVKTIELVRDQYMSNAQQMGAYLQQRLKDLSQRQKTIGNVRGLGLMIGATVYNGQCQPDPQLRNAITVEAFHRGLILLGCGDDSLRFVPPLCVTQDEIDCGVSLLEKAIVAATA